MVWWQKTIWHTSKLFIKFKVYDKRNRSYWNLKLAFAVVSILFSKNLVKWNDYFTINDRFLHIDSLLSSSLLTFRKQPLGGVLKNRCSDSMSLLGISDLFWKILGSWENLRCSGEISPPGKSELFLRNFYSPVKSELFLWKFPSFLCEKTKASCKKLSCSGVIPPSWEKRTCSGVVPPSCQIYLFWENLGMFGFLGKIHLFWRWCGFLAIFELFWKCNVFLGKWEQLSPGKFVGVRT